MITPPNHINFKALKLCSEIDGEIMDCAIAFIDPNGGGPQPNHTHSHDHLLTVISGEIEVWLENEKVTLSENMSMRVPGNKPHSVWNASNSPAKVLGISLASETT